MISKKHEWNFTKYVAFQKQKTTESHTVVCMGFTWVTVVHTKSTWKPYTYHKASLTTSIARPYMDHIICFGKGVNKRIQQNNIS